MLTSRTIAVLITIAISTIQATAADTYEQQAATEVANYATYLIRSMDENGKPLLEVALKLDAECDQALLVKGLLKRKMRPDAVESMAKARVVKGLYKGGHRLMAEKYKNNRNTQQLAALYLATAAKLDPANKDVILDITKLEARGQVVNFEKLLGMKAIIAAPAPKPKIPADAVRFQGHLYKAFFSLMTWSKAKAKCAEMGGSLVIINSAEENKFAAGLAQGKNLWIGASSKGKDNWRWVDGSPVKYSKWFPGQPSYDAKDGLNCVHIGVSWHNKPDQWNDAQDKYQPVTGFVCEWE